MASHSPRIEKLREAGLSEYSARAYVALLDLGTTEAREVSRLGRVPLAKVYATLDQLHARGLVVVHPGSPKRYAPVPFDDFLAREEERHHEAIALLKARRKELAPLLEIRAGSAHVNDRGTVTTLRGRANAIRGVRDAAASAEREIAILASGGDVSHALAKEIANKAAARGVACRVLAPARFGALFAGIAALAGARERPRLLEQGGCVFALVADGRKLVLVHLVPDDASLARGDDLALVVTEAGIVEAIAGLLDHVWERAPGLDGADGG